MLISFELTFKFGFSIFIIFELLNEFSVVLIVKLIKLYLGETKKKFHYYNFYILKKIIFLP